MKTTEHRRTRHFNIMLILLAIAGAAAVLVATDPLARAAQGSAHGRADHRGNGDVALAICDRHHDRRMAGAGIYLESILELDAVQKKAWDQVEGELELGLARLRDVCGKLASDALPPTMPERLAFMEMAMAAGTETLRAVRPAFKVFYGTLDEHQRQKIDAMSRRHDSGVR